MKPALLLLGMLSIANAATAITVQGTPPTAPPAATAQKFSAPAAAKSRSDDSSGLRRGTIEAVSVAGGTFHMHGQSLSFDPKRVKVFSRSGKPASLASLKKGAAVSFTLDPSDKKHQRVAVIYVD
ncbi:MAG TPA: hypothetical protein VMN79_20365 [Casimicrobiaceae bacterium]|nr:hypothetical protein [Casimicrobiaceae bacterium]